ncbi:hypothetical protein JXA85_02410 [Candidatus Woesearchaeota archaeon]|nr:hypothetical protein [Candidatus Woesearchaeota archaeon]
MVTMTIINRMTPEAFRRHKKYGFVELDGVVYSGTAPRFSLVSAESGPEEYYLKRLSQHNELINNAPENLGNLLGSDLKPVIERVLRSMVGTEKNWATFHDSCIGRLQMSGIIRNVLLQLQEKAYATGSETAFTDYLGVESHIYRIQDSRSVYRINIMVPVDITTNNCVEREIISYNIWAKVFRNDDEFREEVEHLELSEKHFPESVPWHYEDRDRRIMFSQDLGFDMFTIMNCAHLTQTGLEKIIIGEKAYLHHASELLLKKAEWLVQSERYAETELNPLSEDKACLIGEFEALPGTRHMPEITPGKLEIITMQSILNLCRGLSNNEIETIRRTVKLAVETLFENTQITSLIDPWAKNLYPSRKIRPYQMIRDPAVSTPCIYRHDYSNWKTGPQQYDTATYLLGIPNLADIMRSERVDDFLRTMLAAHHKKSIELGTEPETPYRYESGDFAIWKKGLTAAMFLRGMRISSLASLDECIIFYNDDSIFSSNPGFIPLSREYVFEAGMQGLDSLTSQAEAEERNGDYGILKQASGILKEKATSIADSRIVFIN